MGFLTERTDNAMLFPRPVDGATVEISPPGLAWLPADGASSYRVEISDAAGGTVHDADTGPHPVHLPDRVLEPGEYSWDVEALDADGKPFARRGHQRFTVAAGVPHLPWVAPEELLTRVPGGHPRLVYLKRNLGAVRATLETTRRQAWSLCLECAERALDVPPPEYPSYHLVEDRTRCRLEYRDYYRGFSRYIDTALIDLSVAFLMTEDARFADHARRILLEVASWPTDDADVTSVSAAWGDEPGLHLARCAHRAYDWLYDALDEEERARVLAMCEGRAWQTYRRLTLGRNYLTFPGSSHDGRLIAYLSEMAVAMAGESEGAATWLDYSLKALTTFYPHWGCPEGGWAEGIGYGLGYNAIYLEAFEGLRAACDYDLWQRPFFGRIRRYFLYCTAVNGEIKPFGDGADRGGPGTAEGERFGSLLAFHAHRFQDAHAGWWAQQVREWKVIRGDLGLVFEDQLPSAPPADAPGSRSFTGVGWAGLHSDLTAPGSDTCMVFKSSPYGSVSHSHADQNAFAILKGGRALAIPSGYYGPSYGQPHHAEWTRSTKANNCVLVNGQGQIIRDHRASGRLIAFKEHPGLTYVAGDAAAAYMGKLERCDRHILFLRPGLFLVLDDLVAPVASRFQWMLHALEEMEIDGNRVVSRREDAVLEARIQCPQGLALSQTDAFDTPYNDRIPEQFHEDLPNHWHVTAETVDTSASTRIGAAMGVWQTGDPARLQVLEHPGWFGASATGSFGTVEGWAQLEPGTTGPVGYAEGAPCGAARLCATAADGQRIVI